MADVHPTLTSRAERVISALLTEQSIEDAAKKTGVASRSIHRWLREDASFQSAYRAAKRRVVEQAQSRIQKATGKAVETLIAVMDDPLAQPSLRVSAAKTILEMAVRSIELDDLESRITALEQAQKASLNGTHRTQW